ncbi:MAG: phosphoglycerate dehydrogenase [Crocinitomicaceae bacterium]|nr:phosphoglycerate dehydrogenase [Crocinitomicaceae bacterium]
MHVLFLDTVHPILEERLTQAGFTCIDGSKLNLSDSEKAVSTVDGIVIRSRFKMDASFLKHAKALKFIARSGAGMENIDEDYCSTRGITLFNAPEGNRNAVGEHALGMLLSLFNKLHFADTEVRNGKWDREGNRGVELDGKTVGIIGFGNNGQAFAKKLRGFDVKVLAHDKYKTGFGDHHVEEVTLHEIYKRADVVSFHIPQNEETIYFANQIFFESFQKPIYLINLSRGKVVETEILVQGLKNKSVLGACLDVLEYEKSSFESFFEQDLNPDFKYLLNSENVILSPHVGGWTHQSYFKLSDVLADKILDHFQ